MPSWDRPSTRRRGAKAGACSGSRRPGPLKDDGVSRDGIERRRGYTDALTAAELSVDDRWARLAEPTRKGGYEAAAALLPEAPDAIFAATDTMALGVFDALTERGLRVPEDIAVVGFDGLPRSPVTEPRLTTVVQPVEDVGRAAVAALVGGAEPPKLVVLPTQLQLGESCGVAAR